MPRTHRIADPRRRRVGSTLRFPAALLQLEPAQAEIVHVLGDVLAKPFARLELPAALAEPGGAAVKIER